MIKTWQEIVKESKKRLKENYDYQIYNSMSDVFWGGILSLFSISIVVFAPFIEIKLIGVMVFILSIFIIFRSKDWIYKLDEERVKK